MEILGLFLGLFGSLLPIAIVAAIVYAIVRLMRRRPATGPDDPGMGTVRRLYFYTVALIALVVAVNGLAQIGRFVLDSLFGGDVVSGSRVGLAVGISLSVVGLAVWGIHWRLIQRSVATMPVEARAVMRKLYLYVVLGIAAGFLLWSSGDILLWLFGELDFNALSWSFLAIWGGVWAYHWRLEADEGQPTVETLGIRRAYLYAVSAVTLVMAAMGAGVRRLRHPARGVRVALHAARPDSDPGRAVGRGDAQRARPGDHWRSRMVGALPLFRQGGGPFYHQADIPVRGGAGWRSRGCGSGPGHPAVRPARLADRGARGERVGGPLPVPDRRDSRAGRRGGALAVPPSGRCGARRACPRWARRRRRGSTHTSSRRPAWPCWRPARASPSPTWSPSSSRARAGC